MKSNQKKLTNKTNNKTTQPRLLEEMTYELIPLKNVHEQGEYLPQSSTISITCSPSPILQREWLRAKNT